MGTPRPPRPRHPRTLTRSTEIDLLSTQTRPRSSQAMWGHPSPLDPGTRGLSPVVQKLIFSVHKLARGAPKLRGDTSPPRPRDPRTLTHSTEIDLLSTQTRPRSSQAKWGHPAPLDPGTRGLSPVVQKLIFSVHKLARGAPKRCGDTPPPSTQGPEDSHP